MAPTDSLERNSDLLEYEQVLAGIDTKAHWPAPDRKVTMPVFWHPEFNSHFNHEA